MKKLRQILEQIKRIDRLSLLALIIILPIALYKWTNNDFSKKDILKDYAVTIGKITEYYIVGDAGTHHLTYEYKIKGKTYERSINPEVYFDVCAKNIALCGYRHFWVIYSKKDNSKSLIDLTEEIQGRKDNEIIKPFPKAIDNFK